MPGVVTRNPSTNALVFNSEDVPYGMCLGMYTIPAGQSWSVSWPQLAGTAIRVTAIYSSFSELGVSVSYPGSVPTASTSPRNYARSLLVFCSGQPTSVSGPALRFRSSAGGNIALSPKGRGLNFIGKASLVDMTPGGGGPSLVIPDTQGSAPPYYVFRISWPTKPVPVFRIQAGQYISPNSEFYSVGAGLWEMQVCSLVSLPGNSGSSWPAITQPEIYCFGLPTSAGAVTVRDHDTGEIAFNLTAAPLLVIDGHHDWGAGDAGASRAIPGGIPGGYCGVIGSTGMSGTDVFNAGANRWRVLGKQGAFSLSGGSIVLNQMYVQMYIVNGAESPVDQRVAASNELVNLARY
ncbi:hypothetical protein [Roseateles chitosanitabidus]|uniref:hypothetical protein n=1 Tax=Roseateles chitosanitabidus TaxID=65048 RepID=UPI000835EDAF|nr:hypothetical protein [Roseateles chitosanitabidus]